ncbi:hypothetical protein [Granulicella tundricola]|uniref:hypothetical protein n=1 Tax=Granulicella tundricola TaxID=940615 RepID=UPI0012F741EE|nr:hypothetical protein [Granulicella tundricola]
MPLSSTLTHGDAYRYVAAWAAFDHDSLAHISDNGKEFFGTMGGIDFQYAESDHILHVWGLIMPGAAPFLTTKAEIKQQIDQTAHDHPEETAGAVFDIRTLPWNKQSIAKLEPRLYLRLDLADTSIPTDQAMKRFKNLRDAAYVWHRQKMLEILNDWWAKHPEAAKKYSSAN